MIKFVRIPETNISFRKLDDLAIPARFDVMRDYMETWNDVIYYVNHELGVYLILGFENLESKVIFHITGRDFERLQRYNQLDAEAINWCEEGF